MRARHDDRTESERFPTPGKTTALHRPMPDASRPAGARPRSSVAKPGENHFALRPPALDERVGAGEVGGVDGAETLA